MRMLIHAHTYQIATSRDPGVHLIRRGGQLDIFKVHLLPARPPQSPGAEHSFLTIGNLEIYTCSYPFVDFEVVGHQ